MNNIGLSRKVYLELTAPSESDSASFQERLECALKEQNIEAKLSLPVLRKLYPLCEKADWKVTVSLSWNGNGWEAVELEEGDTEETHYGLAVDLGSTSVVMQLVDCRNGIVIAQESMYNKQIAFGEDILSRIFYSKDHPQHLEEIRRATVETFTELMERLRKSSGIDTKQCISMVISGNTTMIHFLIGMDAFCVFAAPYAVRADRPAFFKGSELELPVRGYVYCYPAKANYLGGDIISGMIATGMHKKEEITLFFDVGTNGELVMGNRDFLLCGAGAAGPALEGGVVKTGMRAADGAVEGVKLQDGTFVLEVIGSSQPKGICGSGIVDLISELFLNGWVDLRGKLQPECSTKIAWRSEEGQLGVEYAPGLWFYESDIEEFMKTKAAAYTMIDILLSESGMTLDDVSDFYMAGAFGTHIRKEAAVNIGMYPDVEESRIHTAGNSSLEGARIALLDRSVTDELDQMLDLMTYVQLGAVQDFLHKMVAATALPHTDLYRYPSVEKRLKEKQKTSRIQK